MRTEIIYEDDDILVVYKPGGLATQTARLGQADVVSELKGYLGRKEKNGKRGEIPYLGIIHRLDQPVEGLLVFAKNKKAAGDLTAQLQRQGAEVGLHKHYYAVLCGKPAENEGELVDEMYKSPDNVAVIVEKAAGSNRAGCNKVANCNDAEGKKAVGCDTPAEAKEARLRYRILWASSERDRVGAPVLADIEIFTGRFHQIRAQMAHAGWPLLGDLKYGNDEAKECARVMGVRNVALCAYSLEFMHPVTKKKMSFGIEPRGVAFSLCGTHEK